MVLNETSATRFDENEAEELVLPASFECTACIDADKQWSDDHTKDAAEQDAYHSPVAGCVCAEASAFRGKEGLEIEGGGARRHGAGLHCKVYGYADSA